MIVPVADYDFPDDLLQLQRAFDAAEERCVELAAALPSGMEIAEGTAGDIAEQQDELQQERANRLDLVVKLQGHPWWEASGNRFQAKEALRKAARQ